MTPPVTVLVKRMGGDFADNVGVALRGDFFKVFLDVFGVGRGGVGAGGGDGANDTGFNSRLSEEVVEKGAGSSFAVSTSNADKGKFPGGEEIEEIKKDAFREVPKSVFDFLNHEVERL